MLFEPTITYVALGELTGGTDRLPVTGMNHFIFITRLDVLKYEY